MKRVAFHTFRQGGHRARRSAVGVTVALGLFSVLTPGHTEASRQVLAQATVAQSSSRPPGGAGTACPGGTVYLTLDTGSMRHAELIAQILRRHDVKATFFLANEQTPEGDFSLDERWRGYWRDRVSEGHAFGSHTYDHVYFRSASADGRMSVRPQFGEQAGRTLQWDARAVCGEIDRVQQRFRALTGADLDRYSFHPLATVFGYTSSPAVGEELVREVAASDPDVVVMEACCDYTQATDGDMIVEFRRPRLEMREQVVAKVTQCTQDRRRQRYTMVVCGDRPGGGRSSF